jgi:hypothetical protein
MRPRSLVHGNSIFHNHFIRMELKASLFCDTTLNEPPWSIICAFVRKILSALLMTRKKFKLNFRPIVCGTEMGTLSIWV